MFNKYLILIKINFIIFFFKSYFYLNIVYNNRFLFFFLLYSFFYREIKCDSYIFFIINRNICNYIVFVIWVIRL